MSDRTYPPLPASLGLSLEAVRMQMEFDPGYLLDEECPYPEQLKTFLRRLVAPAQVGRDDMVTAVFKADQTGTEQADSLIEEVQLAINGMKRLQQEMESEGDRVEVSDKLNFLKNYGSMMDKWLSLKEKAQGIKQMYEFQRLVITVMEQVLDKDERLDFKNRLKAAGIAA